MRLGDLSESEIARALAGPGLALDFGLAKARIRTPISDLAALLRLLYAGFPALDASGFFDVTASLVPVRGVRRWVRPQVTFLLDGKEPFDPFPADTHLPLLEWGLNWAIANRSNTTLLLHAGALERAGRCLLLPALPGSGKSTLTAALATSGYRLLSDEFGAVRLTDGMVVPALRPISLKNESIEVMRSFAPLATIGPIFPRTRKGSVAHFAPDAVSAAKRHEPALPALIVFPRFRPGAVTTLEPMAKADAFAKLAANSFNYEILGPEGFEAMGRVIERCLCFRLSYSRLVEAINAIGGQLEQSTSGEEVASQLLPVQACS